MRPRVAVVGYGVMGRRHADALEGHADLVIVDPVVGVPSLDVSVDAAIVAVPAEAHARVVLPLLRAGVPCLVEKPLATTLEDADELATHAHAWVGHVERFNPAFLALRDAARRHDWRHAAFLREGPRPERGVDLDAALDLLVHDLDLLAQLAPDDPVVRMEARAHDAPGVLRSEGIVVTLTLASGRTATVRAARGVEARRRELSLYVAVDGFWGRGAVGPRSTSAALPPAESRALHADLLARTAMSDAAPLAVTDGDALRAQDLAFLAAARGEVPCGPSLATAGEGRDVVVFALRALHLRDRAGSRP